MNPARPDVDLPRVVRLWVPLAASWLMMAAEQPLMTAVVARMADQKVHLAAWGAVVFPIALVIEAPIIMLLAASTALCEDWASYRKVRRFMHASGAALTVLHVAVAFTPLYDLVTGGLLDTPPDVARAARPGLQLMTPWTWAIAYRRFQQGVLIRFEHGRAVTQGTLVRLAAVAGALTFGAAGTDWPGVVVGSFAIAAGVTAEALFAGIVVRPFVRRLRSALPSSTPLDRRRFLGFYVPLAMTPLVVLCLQPLGAAAMGRMPAEIDSLAAWSPVWTLVFLPRSVGMAYNEVVVALVAERGAVRALRRFSVLLLAGTTGALLLVAATPLAGLWFEEVQGLAPDLAGIARVAAVVALPMPAYQVLQSWYQGALVKARRTAPVTEAVVLYGAIAGGLCWLGVRLGATAGIHWALGAFVVAGVCQTAWLWARSRTTVATFEAL